MSGWDGIDRNAGNHSDARLVSGTAKRRDSVLRDWLDRGVQQRITFALFGHNPASFLEGGRPEAVHVDYYCTVDRPKVRHRLRQPPVVSIPNGTANK